jgi:hypothetical protein
VRWVYAQEEEELIEFVLRRENVQRTEPGIVVENSQTRWVLFDSASNPLVDRPAMLEANLPLGRLVIDTALLGNERNSAIIHRFLRTHDA